MDIPDSTINLRTSKAKGESIAMMMSDNGGYSKSYFSHASNGKLKGEKGSLYEGGIRIPSSLCWRGKIKANQIITDPRCNVDVLPILANIIEFNQLIVEKKNELFNLSNDASESKDLSQQYPEKFLELKNGLNACKMQIQSGKKNEYKSKRGLIISNINSLWRQMQI